MQSVHAETQFSKFQSLVTLYCKVQNDYFLFFARKNAKEEKERIINRTNTIFGIILFFIDNDGHVTNHLTNFRLHDT